MTRRFYQIDLRLLLLVGMLVVLGVLAVGRERPHTASAPGPRVPPGRLALGGSLPDHQIRFYQARLTENPRDTASWDMLAIGYMRKLRESGDPGYALRAEEALHRALMQDSHDREAPRLLAWAALVKHEFANARRQAEALIRRTPDDGVYGILGDADIELGLYPEAQQAFQRMMDLKPGLAVYTRASYLRELHGDIPGALEMMQFAVEAASPRDRENLAWTLVQLGHLYFNHGNLTQAEHQYAAALHAYPSYLYALAGLGNVRAVQGRYAEAISLYERSLAVIPLPEVAGTLGDVYARLGRREDAERQYALVEYIGRLTPLNEVVYNRDLAFFFADHDRRLDQAVALAEREAAVRRDIYTADTVAWAYFKEGRLVDAERMMQRALGLGTRDARLFYHAGMIAWKQGDRLRARVLLTQALRTNPYFHVLHADEARNLLDQLSH